MRKRVLSFIAISAAAYLAASAIARLRARRFDDQVVVITGGSRGLGFALALEWARRGANLVLVARDADELSRARNELGPRARALLTVQADVRLADDAHRVIQETLGRFSRIDVLVNDAGTITVGPMETMTREDYMEALDTHFWGSYNMVEAAWPAFRRQHDGAIVNITSIGGRVSVPHLLPYSVSKFAQVGYSEGLRAEAARFGVRVTTVTPGLMRTGSPRNAWFKGNNEAEYGWFAVSDSTPLLSVSASYAARRIVDACARGEAHASVGLAAFLATRIYGLSPGLAVRAMTLANAMLPKADASQFVAHQGRGSETAATQSLLTALSRKAVRDYNERA